MKFQYVCYICKDCEIDFLLRPKRGGKFCPSCGEMVYVERARDVWMERPLIYRRHFTPEEDDIIVTGKARGYSNKQIASMLDGRTNNAVYSRWRRIREELTK